MASHHTDLSIKNAWHIDGLKKYQISSLNVRQNMQTHHLYFLIFNRQDWIYPFSLHLSQTFNLAAGLRCNG